MPAAAEQIEKEILEWIENSDDPKNKAFLMILYRMNANLTVNTRLTSAIAKDFTDHIGVFDTHVAKIDKLLAMVRGGYLVALAASVLVQALFGWIVYLELKSQEKLTAIQEVHEHRITVVEERMAGFVQREAELRAAILRLGVKP